MAFKDSTLVLYDGSVKIEYHDKAHRYYRRDRVSLDLPETNDLAWGKAVPVKGVTTLMDGVLEKKGLMTWPMGMALRELFGFYDFKNESGEQMTGYSRGVGTLWGANGSILPLTPEEALAHVLSASKAWQRKKKTGADIGSLVHDAIEQYVLGNEFEITVEKYKEGQEFENVLQEHEWDKQAEADVKCAKLAFGRFKEWWKAKAPLLLGAEALVYSKELDYCGTFDGLIEIDGKKILCDWKTSNASASRDAAAPQGVYYSYFIQSAAYAHAWKEMGNGDVDDLLIVSARKDGGFDTVSASELGLTVQDCIDWWKAVVLCAGFASKTKTGLLNNVKAKEKTDVTVPAQN